MIEQLNELDTRLFLFLNGIHNSFFDFIMYWASDRFIWIPFYAVIVYLLIKVFKIKFIVIALMIISLIILTDQISAHLIKPFVYRLRPCHNMTIAHEIHLIRNYCGGQFGFVSSHASNCFAFATFVSLVAKDKIPYLKYILLPWAVFVSYSRIYLGVHYPGDVLGGAILGSLSACGIYWVYKLWTEKASGRVLKNRYR